MHKICINVFGTQLVALLCMMCRTVTLTLVCHVNVTCVYMRVLRLAIFIFSFDSVKMMKRRKSSDSFFGYLVLDLALGATNEYVVQMSPCKT